MSDFTLRSAGAEDVELLASWLARPETARWLTSQFRVRPANAAFVALIMRSPRNRLFVVEAPDRDDPVAVVGLADVDDVDGTAMIWYALGDTTLQGRGVTTAGVALVLRHAFEELGLESVNAWTMADNAASQRVLLKNGFAPVGTMRRSARVEGTVLDRHYFDIVAADFAAKDGEPRTE